MAKIGRETPKPIQDFILATKRNAWALTQAQIAVRVESEFGEESAVDKSTVGRILQRAGLTGGRYSSYDSDESAPVSDLMDEGHQQVLLTEVKRLKSLIMSAEREILRPSGGIERKVYEALCQHIGEEELSTLLDRYDSALSELITSGSDVATRLGSELGLLKNLNINVALSPWDEQVLGTLKQRTRFAKNAEEIEPEHRTYDPELDGHHLKPFTPKWGGFSLTTSGITNGEYRTIHDLHLAFREKAEEFLPALQNLSQELNQCADSLIDGLDDLLLNRHLPGTCRYCEGAPQ